MDTTKEIATSSTKRDTDPAGTVTGTPTVGDGSLVASVLAVSILGFFLARYYRRHMAPAMHRGNWIRALSGIAVIVFSILLSLWLRRG